MNLLNIGRINLNYNVEIRRERSESPVLTGYFLYPVGKESMNEELMCYTARMPEDTDCFAVAIDRPEYKKPLAKDIADWIKRGAVVEHVTLSDGQASFGRYCDRK